MARSKQSLKATLTSSRRFAASWNAALLFRVLLRLINKRFNPPIAIQILILATSQSSVARSLLDLLFVGCILTRQRTKITKRPDTYKLRAKSYGLRTKF